MSDLNGVKTDMTIITTHNAKQYINKQDTKTVGYPLVAVSSDENVIVLFKEAGYGFVLWSNDTRYTMGQLSCTWMQGDFKPLTEGETLTLKNKWED